MRYKNHTRRAPVRRNPVVLGLVRRVITAAAGRHKVTARPTRQEQDKDLDQRVREVGEW